jgi:hypothetical protein
VLRLPATPIRSLICFASRVHAILLVSCLATCAPGRSEVPSEPGSLFYRRPELPVCSHVDVNGTSQVSRRSIPCLCPALRPRPNRRPLASWTASSMLPPPFPRQGLQRFLNFGAQSRGLSTRCLRFKNGVATIPARLASGRLARLYREGVEPSGSLQKVSDHSSPFSGLTPGAREISASCPPRPMAQSQTSSAPLAPRALPFLEIEPSAPGRGKPHPPPSNRRTTSSSCSRLR